MRINNPNFEMLYCGGERVLGDSVYDSTEESRTKEIAIKRLITD